MAASPLLVIATHNSHKTAEFRHLLGSIGTEVADLKSFPDIPPADESGMTFEGNATIKAVEASRALTNTLVIADDSGLEVDALDGAPGVHSARFSGPEASDADNRRKLLDSLVSIQALDPGQRTARFHCSIVVACNGEKLGAFDGAVEGRIDHRESGDRGFGYDPIFIPDGYEQSFGELPPDVKQSISHRARAVARARKFLMTRISKG